MLGQQLLEQQLLEQTTVVRPTVSATIVKVTVNRTVIRTNIVCLKKLLKYESEGPNVVKTKVFRIVVVVRITKVL